MAKTAIINLKTQNKILRKLAKTETVFTFSKDIGPLPKQKISSAVQQFPFLQTYAPNTNPISTAIIKHKNMKILYMNIDGGAKA